MTFHAATTLTLTALVAAGLEAFRVAAAVSEDVEGVRRGMRDLYRLEFYLSPEQCTEVNDLRRKLERPPGPFELPLPYKDLRPNPDVNASYFTKEETGANATASARTERRQCTKTGSAR
jgi:hypothetical protein